MTRYITRDVTPDDTEIHRIMREEPVKEMIEAGCFVAGGVALAATFGNRSVELYLEQSKGDIDIFASSEEAHREAMVQAGMRGFTSSTMGTAVNLLTKPSGYKLQLVAPRFSGSFEEALEKFDIANCKVATDGKVLVYHEDVPELERTRTLRLDKSPGFMLAWRVVKYMNRGYETLDPASREHIVDWFIRLRTKEWDLQDASRRYFYNKDQIRNFLQDRRLVHDEDLLLAIGFMQMVVEVIAGSGTYDPNEELVKDLALEELEKRLGTKLKFPQNGL